MERNTLGSEPVQDFPGDIDLLPNLTKEYAIQSYQYYQNTINYYFAQIIGEENNVVPENLSETDFICQMLRFLNKYFIPLTNLDGAGSMISLVDICAPTSKRTKVRFKLFNNFLQFIQKQMGKLEDHIITRRRQAMEMSSLIAEKEHQRSKVASVAEGIARSEDEMLELKKQVEEAEKFYVNLQELQEDKEQNCKQLQQDLKTIVGTCENKQTLVKNLKMNIASLNEQVVTADSYDSLSDLKQNLSTKCDKLETDSVNIADCLSEKVVDIDRFKSIHKMIEDLSTIGRELQFEKEVCNKIKTDRDELELKYKANLKDIECQRESILKIKASTKERCTHLQAVQLKYSNLLREIYDNYEQTDIELREERKLHNHLNKDIAVLNQAKTKLIKMIEDKQDNITNLKNFYAGMYTRIIHAENSLTTTFNKAVERILKTTSEE